MRMSLPYQMSAGDGCMIGRFQAMGCPCELLLDTKDTVLAADHLQRAVAEAARIERNYSRYRRGTIVDRINTSTGKAVEVDEETAALFDFAAECYQLSEGLFDITTGILRKVWNFEAETCVNLDQLDFVRSHIGWDRVMWERPFITVPKGFEIDLGGVCKEYAADRILVLLRQRQALSTLVNLGGDIAAAGDRLWTIGIEAPSSPGGIQQTVQLQAGALATSGITKRFIKKAGATYGHILNPKTGRPVEKTPLSVTVAAPTCTEAGFLSTAAMLYGADAETFLKAQTSEFWCYR